MEIRGDPFKILQKLLYDNIFKNLVVKPGFILATLDSMMNYDGPFVFLIELNLNKN
jgi:hypothetical protein